MKARPGGQESFFLVHVENQASTEPAFGTRMFRSMPCGSDSGRSSSRAFPGANSWFIPNPVAAALMAKLSFSGAPQQSRLPA